MSLLVQKFGGSSLSTPERLRRVAGRVVRARGEGHDVVVVVSAMGETTDRLLVLASQLAPDARRRHPRELDMLLTAGERIAMALLAMAIRETGQRAISFTGSQAAIITDGMHTGARIEEIGADRVRAEMARGSVVIVAGFQGVSRRREVTTLGRGGSDTTAVALAAALGAERCDIYTDVDGVYTADPRRVRDARRVDRLDYEEMLELAQSGAQVLHPRAVELAARYTVPVRVRSSFRADDDGGTLIAWRQPEMEELALSGIGCELGHARLVLRGVPAGMRPTAALLSRLAAADVSVDMVAQADRLDGRCQLQLSVREEDLSEVRTVCDELASELAIEAVEVTPHLARVALVGSGMHGRPGVYARAFEALLDAGIDVHGLSTSSISIALLIDADREDEALSALHRTFELGGGGET